MTSISFFIPMAKEMKSSLLIHAFSWLLLSMTCYGIESDVQCLRTLKNQFKDPNGYLSSWDFSNATGGFICKFMGILCWHPDESRVLEIQLSGMGLQGQFPKSLKNCTSLTGLDLSNNNLSGSIPHDMDEIIPFAVKLDLSSNNFSGQLPSDLGNLTYLNILNLQNNRFNGQIPSQLGQLRRLRSFSVANNSLSGKIPAFPNKNFSAASFEGNKGLCGKPLDPCKGAPRN